jgi:hypothetical protein
VKSRGWLGFHDEDARRFRLRVCFEERERFVLKRGTEREGLFCFDQGEDWVRTG